MIDEMLFKKGHRLSLADFKQKINDAHFFSFVDQKNGLMIIKYDDGDKAEEFEVKFIQDNDMIEIKKADFRTFMSTELFFTTVVLRFMKIFAFSTLLFFIIYFISLR